MAKIPRGIVITTSEYTKDFLDECLNSLGDKYPVLVVSNMYQTDKADIINDWNGFELGGILRGYENFDEFIHLMDTCRVDDKALFDKMFEHDGSVFFCRGFYSYLGKYRSDILEKAGIPRVNTKADAIAQENQWNRHYLSFDQKAILFDPELPIHTTKFEEKNGRRNMVLENGFLTKWKGTWA